MKRILRFSTHEGTPPPMGSAPDGFRGMADSHTASPITSVASPFLFRIRINHFTSYVRLIREADTPGSTPSGVTSTPLRTMRA